MHIIDQYHPDVSVEDITNINTVQEINHKEDRLIDKCLAAQDWYTETKKLAIQIQIEEEIQEQHVWDVTMEKIRDKRIIEDIRGYDTK